MATKSQSELSPEAMVQELREIAGLGDRGKWPLTVTADDALDSIRRNLHQLADDLEKLKAWAAGEDRLMNLKEAASYYGTSTDKLKELAATGWRCAVPFGSGWRFRRA